MKISKPTKEMEKYMKPNEILELPIFDDIQKQLKKDGWRLTKYDSKQKVWFAYRTYIDEENPQAFTLTIVFDEDFKKVVTSYVEFPSHYTLHNDFDKQIIECAYMALKSEEERIRDYLQSLTRGI